MLRASDLIFENRDGAAVGVDAEQLSGLDDSGGGADVDDGRDAGHRSNPGHPTVCGGRPIDPASVKSGQRRRKTLEVSLGSRYPQA
jgi:hypothetical protein